MAYTEKIIIEQYTDDTGDYGEADAGTWSTYRSCFAEVVDSSSDEDFESDMVVYRDVKKFKFRTVDAPDVTSKMRVNYDSRYFDIIGISKEGRRFTTLTAEAYDDE